MSVDIVGNAKRLFFGVTMLVGALSAASVRAEDLIYQISDDKRDFLYQYGEYLSGECVSCHKISWDYAGIPFIFMLDEAYFLETMRAYQTGEKDNAAMRSVASNLDDEMIQALAVYLALQDPDL